MNTKMCIKLKLRIEIISKENENILMIQKLVSNEGRLGIGK